MSALRLALLGVVLLSASSARAVCTEVNSCFCLDDGTPRSTTGTVEATILTIDGARAQFSVETVRGTAGGFVAGNSLTLPRQNEDVVGTRWLLFFADDGFHTRKLISDGTVSCGLVMGVQEATDVFAQPDCQSALDARGVAQPPCNDVGRLCGCSTGGLPIAAALLLLALRLRSRRSDLP